MVLETRADTATWSRGLRGACGEMVEYSDMGSEMEWSFTPFCDGAAAGGDFPGCMGGRGARYLTLPGCGWCGGVVGFTGCTPTGMGGAGDLKDFGFGEILGLGDSNGGDAGPRAAGERATEDGLSV